MELKPDAAKLYIQLCKLESEFRAGMVMLATASKLMDDVRYGKLSLANGDVYEFLTGLSGDIREQARNCCNVAGDVELAVNDIYENNLSGVVPTDDEMNKY